MTDVLVRNASQVVTMATGGGPKRGPAMRDPGVVDGGAVLIREGRIAAVGPESEVLMAAAGPAAEDVDAERGVVLPGFVDPHTHLLFAGSRPLEFEARLVQGRPFTEFIASGGGAMSTVRATRAASDEELAALLALRLRRFAERGTTTAEVKSGYGLSVDEELRQLRIIAEVARRSPIRVVATALPAHFRPPDAGVAPDAYIEEICDRLLPTVAAEGLATSVDVFVDASTYSTDQARRILEAARRLGLATRLHADQLADDGATELAVEMGCLSADHLGHASPAAVAALGASNTVGVLVPGSLFFVPGEAPAPVEALLAAGAALAVATDCTPGTSPIASMPLAISLAMVLFHMSAAEALAAATINAAHALGLADEVGSLEPGKRADLAIYEAADYHEIPYRFGDNLLRRVIRDGTTVVTRDAVGPI
jgi:imidazolonepropionase